MNFDIEEILVRIIKYILIIVIITIAINIFYIYDIKYIENNNIKFGIFIGLISACIYAIYDYFIPAIPVDIKKKINLIK